MTLCLSLNTSKNTPRRFDFTLPNTTAPVNTASSAVSSKCFNSSSLDVPEDLGQTQRLPIVLHHIYAAVDATSTASAPIVSSPTAMITQELMEDITPIIIYLQVIAANYILPNILHTLTSNTAQPHQCL